MIFEYLSYGLIVVTLVIYIVAASCTCASRPFTCDKCRAYQVCGGKPRQSYCELICTKEKKDNEERLMGKGPDDVSTVYCTDSAFTVKIRVKKLPEGYEIVTDGVYQEGDLIYRAQLQIWTPCLIQSYGKPSVYLARKKKLCGADYLRTLRIGTIFRYNGKELQWDGNEVTHPGGALACLMSYYRFITEEDCEILWEPSE